MVSSGPLDRVVWCLVVSSDPQDPTAEAVGVLCKEVGNGWVTRTP